MKIPIYQLDAFTSTLFHGNPAAVCPLERWLDDATMQSIAAENNLAETAFYVGSAGRYEIRWFTPSVEMDLCGHATLASAYVVFQHEPALREVRFASRSGELTVTREGDRLVLDFPNRDPRSVEIPAEAQAALGAPPQEAWQAVRDLMLVYRSEDEIRNLKLDFAAIGRIATHCVIATAPGQTADYVYRFFAPNVGVPEDPATGSAQSTLIPYWSRRLGKTRLRAFQLSARGAEFFCELAGDRVKIGGHVVPYLEGSIEVAPAVVAAAQ
jgi:PhzF family phenazine biosynthesis protein